MKAAAELSGRPAQKFTVLISERQFQVVWDGAEGDQVMALSSSMDTFLKSVAQMLKLSTGSNVELQVRTRE